MHVAIVSILFIALIVFGGLTVAQGYLTSVDISASGSEQMSKIDGQIMRTTISAVNASSVSWADILRLRLANSGQVKLASFNKWDFIVDYYDAAGNHYTKWLLYASGAPETNKWYNIGLYANGKAEMFEPAIFNPGEEMVIGARLDPPPGPDTTANIIISTPNGVQASTSFPVGPGYPLLTPHSEDRTIAATAYYQLKEGISSDGMAIIETTDIIEKQATGRWLLYEETDDSRPARHVYSLAGIDQIPAATWTVYYRAQSTAKWVDDAYPGLNIDIVIRKADGTVRTTLASGVAEAILNSPYAWQTVSATYSFPGYTVADYSDYLEVDYYGKSSGGGPDESGFIQLAVDDGSLPATDQTRIRA